MTKIQNCFEHLDLAQIIHSEFRSNGVIIWLDRIIQSFPLDCPIERLCRNVILRLQPKNLSLIRHRFNEILHFVQNDNIPFQGNCDTVSKPWNDNNVVLLMNFLVNLSITTINDYLPVIARSLRSWQSNNRQRKIASLSLAMTILTAGFVYV